AVTLLPLGAGKPLEQDMEQAVVQGPITVQTAGSRQNETARAELANNERLDNGGKSKSAEPAQEQVSMPEPVESPALRLVAIGDSLTQGVGDRTGSGGYVNIVQDGLRQRESMDVH